MIGGFRLSINRILPPSDEGGGTALPWRRERKCCNEAFSDYPSVTYGDSSPDKGSRKQAFSTDWKHTSLGAFSVANLSNFNKYYELQSNCHPEWTVGSVWDSSEWQKRMSPWVLTKGLLEILHCVQNDTGFRFSIILRNGSDEESACEHYGILR